MDRIPVRMGSTNFCEFRGMLFKSSIYFHGQIGASVMSHRGAELVIGDHPRLAPLKKLGIGTRPLATCFFPASAGILDDHYEGWFLSFDDPPTKPFEGLESVVGLVSHKPGCLLRRQRVAYPSLPPLATSMGSRQALRWEPRALKVVAGLTAASGILQMVCPGLVLGRLARHPDRLSRHLFGTIGMFMAVSGGTLHRALHSPGPDPGLLSWAARPEIRCVRGSGDRSGTAGLVAPGSQRGRLRLRVGPVVPGVPAGPSPVPQRILTERGAPVPGTGRGRWGRGPPLAGARRRRDARGLPGRGAGRPR